MSKTKCGSNSVLLKEKKCKTGLPIALCKSMSFTNVLMCITVSELHSNSILTYLKLRFLLLLRLNFGFNALYAFKSSLKATPVSLCHIY
jgi:hypothetical protein